MRVHTPEPYELWVTCQMTPRDAVVMNTHVHAVGGAANRMAGNSLTGYYQFQHH